MLIRAIIVCFFVIFYPALGIAGEAHDELCFDGKRWLVPAPKNIHMERGTVVEFKNCSIQFQDDKGAVELVLRKKSIFLKAVKPGETLIHVVPPGEKIGYLITIFVY